MEFSPKTYIVIPVHNRKVTTLNCLDHLQKNGDLDECQVVIVDDGSTDGTTEAISSRYPGIIVLAGNGDLWWTGGIAMGMEYAHDQGAEFIIWLNDDCLPEPGTLSKLVAFMESHPSSLAAPTCYAGSLNGEAQHNGFKGRTGCNAIRGEVLKVDGLSGWCAAMPASVVERVGLPNIKRFPHYSGDDIYTLQVTKAGYGAYLLGDLAAVLYGPVHAKLALRDYFKPGLKPGKILRSIFWDKKSPYRLPTRFFVMAERYGWIRGLPLFTTKLLTWLVQYVRFQLVLWINPKAFEVHH